MATSGHRKLAFILTGVVALLAVGAGLFLLLRPEANRGYSQDSPDDTLRTAIAMVKNGEAQKIPTLIHADKPELRAVLKRLGDLFASSQDLAYEVNRAFPEDVKRIKEQFKQELAAGTAPTLMGMLPMPPPGDPTAPGTAGNPRGFDPETMRKRFEDEMRKREKGGGGGGGQSGSITLAPGGAGMGASVTPPSGNQGMKVSVASDPERQFQALAARILADPFGWVTENAAKLSTERIADDQAAVLFDGKAVPPFGLTMREVNRKWYFVLPLNSPGVSQFMPQTRHEWSIIGSLLKVLDNAVKDVADEVRSGKVRRIEKLAESVGEKAFIPGAVVAVMYGKEMDARQRRDKAMSAFKKRWNTWLNAREGDDPAALNKVADAVNRVALEELDHLVRLSVKDPANNKLPEFAKLTDTELTQLVEGWLSNKGGLFNLGPPLTTAAIEAPLAKVDAWFSGKVQRKKK